MSEPSTFRPFVFSVIEDHGENVTIEISEEDYQADLAVGIDEDDTLKPGRYKMKHGGFLSRNPELNLTAIVAEGDDKKGARVARQSSVKVK